MIIERWSSNEILQYIQIKLSNLSKGISDLMLSTQAFYIVQEAEYIYYTLEQPGFQ